MMKRWLLLEGVRGTFVSPPGGLDPLAYVGQRRKGAGECAHPAEKSERYEPLARAYPDHPDLRKAVARGALKLHGEPYLAASVEEALAKADAMKAHKPKRASGE